MSSGRALPRLRVFSCFYARFRRIGPLIAAHAFWDLVLTIHLL
jgi:membrane protease YdiL (CAAX protease family)